MGRQNPGEVDKYSQELKEKWPGIKDQFKEKWQQGLEKGGEAKDQVTKWMNDTSVKKEWIRLKPGLTTSRPVPRKSYRSARPLPPIHALSETRWTNAWQVTARRSHVR